MTLNGVAYELPTPVLPTVGSGYSFLPTPMASDGEKGGPNQRGGAGDLRLSSAVHLMPTPEAKLSGSGPDYARANRAGSGGDDLTTTVFRTLLPTPTTTQRGQDSNLESRESAGPNLHNAVALMPTPQVADATGGHATRSGKRSNELLLPGVAMSLLPTPAANDSGNTPENHLRKKPGRQVVTSLMVMADYGLIPTGGRLMPSVAANSTQPPTTSPPETTDTTSTPMSSPVVERAGTTVTSTTAVDSALVVAEETAETFSGDDQSGPTTRTTGSRPSQLFPTPTVQDASNTGGPSQLLRNTPPLNSVAASLADASGIRGDEGDDVAGVGGEEADRAGVVDERGSRPRATEWGPYRPAIERWEAVTGHVAPPATNPDGRGGSHRLAPEFVEWMMGLPAGHFTAPEIGLTRNQQLKAGGNGVVPQQAELAVSYLLGRVRARLAA